MSVEFDFGFRVTIKDDYDLVADFIRWQLEHKIFSYRGSSSGRGCSIEWFPLEHEDRVFNFFHERNYRNMKKETTNE